MPMRNIPVLALGAMGALALSACASTSFVSTWKAPDAQPLTGEGSKVAAVVMSEDEAARRAGEDALAREITARGAEGIPMYTLVPGAKPDEDTAKAAFAKAGIAGVVVLRPVSKDKAVVGTPSYSGPYYGGFWGGYYGYGWGSPWGMGGTDIRTDTIVTVETLVYSLKQNKLVWAGQSKTTNPDKVDSFVREIVNAAASEMKKEGLI
jgi:hypothetical protein